MGRRGTLRTAPIGPAAVRLQGWGRSSASTATVRTGIPGPADVTGPAPRGLLARGAGQGYGDAALNSGGTVLQLPVGSGQVLLDATTGITDVEAGVPLRRLLRVALAAGWLPPVLPGTGRATVGGAVAADVHGKNHPVAGSFGAGLLGLTVLAGSGELLELSPGDPRFGCTVGGLGLTGVVLRARLQLVRSPGAWMAVHRHRARDLDQVLTLLEGADHAVAWLDGHRTGADLGRGLVDTATFRDGPAPRPGSRTARLPSRDPGSVAAQSIAALAARLPGPGLMQPAGLRAVNAAVWAGSGGSGGTTRLTPIEQALFPLDEAGGWPQLFGRRGLVQYQIAVPAGRVDVLEDTLATLARRGCPPALATLKRLGDPLPGSPLSFPIPGWTLALDLPAAAPGLAALLDRLDDDLADAGGRVYLVKDSRLRPELVPVMYPELDRWRSVRDAMDPDHRFRSDLDRRLDLGGDRALDRARAATGTTR
jgi:decaprenylphospho-beta-D-ribofuranose 2-oxidase